MPTNNEIRTHANPGVRLSKTNYSLTDNSAKKSPSQQKINKLAAHVKDNVTENYEESYARSVAYAAGLGITHVMIGATVMTTFMFSANHGDPHVAFFMLAYHFFAAEAILTLSNINNWSTIIQWQQRRYVHMFLQTCGLLCCLIGTIFVKGSQLKCIHGISGVITILLTIGAGISGPIILKVKKNSKRFHMTFGVPCFFMSSVCAFSGLFHPHFKQWAGFTVNTVLMFFMAFYSVFIVVTTSLKLWKKMST